MSGLSKETLDFLTSVASRLDEGREILQEEQLSQRSYELLMLFYKSIRTSEAVRNAFFDAFFVNADMYLPLSFSVDISGNRYNISYQTQSSNGSGRLFDTALGQHGASSDNILGSVTASVTRTNLVNSADIETGEIRFNDGYMGIVKDPTPVIQYTKGYEHPEINTLTAANNVQRLFGELGAPPPKLLGMG